MVKKLAFTFFILSGSALSPTFADSNSESPPRISADQINRGCVLEFGREYYPNGSHTLGAQLHDIVTNWACKGAKTIEIDRYEVEGGSPQIATVIFDKGKRFAVLVKWSVSSQASDFQGNFYKVYVYKYDPVRNDSPFIRQDKIMSGFGQGWDGSRDGVRVQYPFKDATSIRRRLHQLEDW